LSRYNWNIIEKGIKHHNPNPIELSLVLSYMYLVGDAYIWIYINQNDGILTEKNMLTLTQSRTNKRKTMVNKYHYLSWKKHSSIYCSCKFITMCHVHANNVNQESKTFEYVTIVILMHNINISAQPLGCHKLGNIMKNMVSSYHKCQFV
jgi:hypothetical protein